MFFADKQEGTESKELKEKLGVDVKKLHLESLLKLGLLEKVPVIGKKGKPLRKKIPLQNNSEGQRSIFKFHKRTSKNSSIKRRSV